MEYPCYNCHQPVEEGTAFCAHCGAPQIRVVLPEPAPALAAAGDDSSSARVASPAAPTVFLPVQWPAAAPPCALAAFLSLVLVLLHLYPVVAMLGAGFLSVVFYRQRTLAAEVRPGSGARLGALGGLFFFALAVVVGAVALVVSHGANDLRNQLLAQLQQNPMHYPAATVQAAVDFIKTPAGFTFMMVMFLFFGFILFLLLGMLGGALAGVLFGRPRRQ